MRRLRISILLIISFISFCPAKAQNVFGDAKWIGAITKADAKTPEGRHYTGSVLKESKAEWDQADPLSRRSIILRRSFWPYKTVKHAELRICGLGFYEATINGKKVGESEFAPAWSDYDKTVYFNTYDVTEYIHSGDNELRVLLGNGFPTLLYFLYVIYEDDMREHVFSDEKWQWTESPVTFNSIYGGEDYDARLEVGSQMEEGRWKPVVVMEGPKGSLCPQIAHPVKIMERYGVKETLRKDSILVLDMGQNLAGYPEITVQGNAGQWLILIPGETLDKDGLVNQRQTGRPHYYTYTLKGRNNGMTKQRNDEEVWHPRFSYYSFRYLQIEGDIDVLKKVESCFVYNSAERIGSFECSNPRINATHQLIDRAIRSNWQAVWTDCPSREKLGWLEQDWLNGEALVYNYDAHKMMEQTMQNIVDAQHDDGSMPEIAPEYTQFTGTWARPFQESPEWGGAIIALPMLCLRHYGDLDLANHHYDAMKRYVNYLATQDSCYILRQGLGDWYDYGPGRAGFSKNTPVLLVSTAHYYQWMCNIYVLAKLLGHKEDSERFNLRADSIRQSFNRTFYDSQKKTYATGSQCSLALPLYLKLVPDSDYQAVLQHLIDDIKAHGSRLTTGDVGNRYLFSVLIENGQRELLYTMLNHDDVPGYGYQIKKGHTTLTEQWDPDMGASMNHFMMAHIENFLIPDLLGIQRTGDLIEIEPHPVGDIVWCKGSTMSAHGPVKVEWHIDKDVFTLDIDIPEGGFADVYMPFSGHAESVTEGHHKITEKITKP